MGWENNSSDRSQGIPEVKDGVLSPSEAHLLPFTHLTSSASNMEKDQGKCILGYLYLPT